MLLLAFGACAEPPATAAAPAAPATSAASTAAPPPARLPAPDRLVAVGDLHGDPAATLAVLQLAGLVDDAGAWRGGDDWLVVTGDYTDRGPDSKGVMATLRRLQREAEAAGGKALILLGNHEVMNMTGDWRYVSEGDLAGYGGAEPRRAAFAPTGEDGAWLRSLDVVAQVGGTVFAHGGVDARWAEVGVRGINALAKAAVAGKGPPEVLGSDGPLWNRAYLLGDPVTSCAELDRALVALSADRMVVGHTTQDSGRVAERCGGRLFGIDTGISAHYGGHLAALAIEGARATPLYPTATPQ
ncbi:MAG: metallophosphoesterase [Myxococcota bacterium]